MRLGSARSGPGWATPYCAERGKGKRTLLFLHAIGANHHAFDRELDRYAARYRVIAWEMPGYGESPALPRMTFPALSDALVALLDSKRVDRAVVVGHSMGGMVAQELVARSPDRVEALVLVATAAVFAGGDGEAQRRFLADRIRLLDEGKTPADLAPALLGGMAGEVADPRGVAHAVACMSAIPSGAYRAALHCLVTFDRRENLASIRCPTLVMAGERDRVAPTSMMERMAKAIPGAVFRVLPGVGHLANLERPELFDAAFEEFLAGLPDSLRRDTPLEWDFVSLRIRASGRLGRCTRRGPT